MQIIRKNGATSNVLRTTLRNSSTGAGLTGLAYNTSGLIISTICDNEETPVAYTVAGSTIEDITTLGTFAAPTATKCRFKAVDGTNHPGLVEIQLADARFAVSGAKVLRITISGATNLLQKDIVVQLNSFDLDDADPDVNVTKVGGTVQTARDLGNALPTAAPGASGGLVAFGTGVGQLNVSSGGAVVSSFLNNAITAASINTGAITNAKFAAGAIDAAAIADNAIDNATFAADTTLKNLHAGTAQSGTLGTIVLAAGASSTNNIYDGHRVQIISGTGANQSRVCNTYNGTSKTVTLTENWATAPDNTSVYVVAPLGDVEVGVCNDKTGYSLATGAIASTTFATGAITADAIAADAIGSSELAASAVTEIAGGITIPTAASIADAVWDETAGDHAGAGSTGAALSAATAPSASTVASAVRTELATELGRIDVAISTISGTAGPGGDAVTLVIKDGGGNAIPDVGVWISQDEAGTNVIAGTLYTNASGEATFMLSADTYYRWCKKAGYNFSNPTAFTVT